VYLFCLFCLLFSYLIKVVALLFFHLLLSACAGE